MRDYKLEEEPEFPITVTFPEMGKQWRFSTKQQLANHLEWFDSSDPDETAVIVDAKGRHVRVKVEALQLIELSLAEH